MFVIIVKAIMNIWSSSTANNSSDPQTTPSVNILPAKDAKISIYMTNDSQNEITGPTKMFSSDKMVRVTSGEWELEIDGSTSKGSIESLSELSYKWKTNDVHSFELLNGYVWMETPNGDLSLTLKYFEAKFAPGSVIIANQNTRASNLYVLRGEAEIKTEGGTARVAGGQMLSLLQSETKNANLGDKIQPLDDFIKQSNMFIKKNGAAVLSDTTWVTGSGTLTESGSTLTTGTGSEANSSSEAIVFTYPEDEMTVENEKITIEGRIVNPNIKKITFEKQDAKILAGESTFSVKDYLLVDGANDINYRAFDGSGDFVMKWVITVHLKKKTTTQKKPDVINYPVSSKDFKITSPSENPFKTTDTSVKLRGSFAADMVKYIKVNNYQLQQFKQFGTSWTYNASIDNGNMEEGVNEYLITYYGPSDELLFSNKVYIVKEKATETPSVTPPSPTTVTPPTTPVVPSTLEKKTSSGSTSSSNSL